MLGILDDVKILELSNIVGGSFLAKLLADQGAQVIKVEKPREGDAARHEPPFLGGVPDPEKSSLFLAFNTNKRGVTLDLENAAGREIFLKLVKNVDIVIESFEPGYLDQLGIGYEAIRSVNPKVILTSLTYFGQTGPYAHYHGDEMVMEAMGGYLYAVTGTYDKPPMGCGLWQMELTGARGAAIASMAALMQQHITGEGQHIDACIMEATVSTPGGLIQQVSFMGSVSRRPGADTNVMDGMHLRTKDGEVTLTTAGTGGKPMETWAEFLKEPKLLDPRFQTRQGRMKFWKEQFDLVQAKLIEFENLDLMRDAMAKGLVIGLVQSTFQVIDSPHLKERGFWVEIEHPKVGKLRYAGPAFLIDGTNPSAGGKPAPLLGQHNVEVYSNELGVSKEELGVLTACGAI